MSDQQKSATGFVAISPGYRIAWPDTSDPSGYFVEDIVALAFDPNEEVVAITFNMSDGFARADAHSYVSTDVGYLAPGQTLNDLRAHQREIAQMRQEMLAQMRPENDRPH